MAVVLNNETVRYLQTGINKMQLMADIPEKMFCMQQMFGITGPRGLGKTTMMLQYLKHVSKNQPSSLYVSADYTWFYENSLTDLAHEFMKNGGRLLMIDEIHKYPGWSRELKNMYDTLPDLQVIFTASSALDILKGESDLSRRAIRCELPGISFREYLRLIHNTEFPVITLETVLSDAGTIAVEISSQLKILPLFRQYLKHGYFPFYKDETDQTYLIKLDQIINTILKIDLQTIENLTSSNVAKLKKLLGVIATSAPFKPNISNISQKLGIGRDTVKTYLTILEKARILNLLVRESKGMASLQKPDKIYLENTNFSHVLKDRLAMSNLRETYFINQVRNAGRVIKLAKQGDFIVDGHWTFEIGGATKQGQQLQSVENAYIVQDETEQAYFNHIPLWLFGFLY